LEFEPIVSFIAQKLPEKEAFEVEYICIKLAEQRGFTLVNIIGVPRNRSNMRLGCGTDNKTVTHTVWNKGKTGLQVAWNRGKVGVQVAWNKGLKGIPSYQSKLVTCPHCDKVGSNRAMYRWHFDRCKRAERATKNHK
jgi:hypothetical protein